jgi:hypothetical protein
MKPGRLGWLLLVLATNAMAHRLDEYLQATRIAVFTNHIALSLDLTPGVAVVEQLLADIDQDRDGQLSAAEGAAYAQQVLKDVRVGLDGKFLALSLVDASFPALREVKTGLGVIRLKATARIEPLAGGRHALNLTNTHLPGISVYLVNALVPKDPVIKITRQTRDELQRSYRLVFEVTRRPRISRDGTT